MTKQPTFPFPMASFPQKNKFQLVDCVALDVMMPDPFIELRGGRQLE